jgi:hypothetical protein
LASLLAVLHTECGIPLSRPFPDAMPPGPWAVESFSRRHAGKWGKVAGWYGHIEIPENSHWDPGAYKWAELLAAAKARRPSARTTDGLVGMAAGRTSSANVRTASA